MSTPACHVSLCSKWPSLRYVRGPRRLDRTSLDRKSNNHPCGLESVSTGQSLACRLCGRAPGWKSASDLFQPPLRTHSQGSGLFCALMFVWAWSFHELLASRHWPLLRRSAVFARFFAPSALWFRWCARLREILEQAPQVYTEFVFTGSLLAGLWLQDYRRGGWKGDFWSEKALYQFWEACIQSDLSFADSRAVIVCFTWSGGWYFRPLWCLVQWKSFTSRTRAFPQLPRLLG